MKVGVLSDTHDDKEAVARAVDLFNARGTEMVIHAGDCENPSTVELLESLQCPFTGVYGNCDAGLEYSRRSWAGGQLQRQPLRISLEGKNAVVVHQHHRVTELAASGAYDLIIYGHLHVPDVRFVGKTLVVNPGKTARQREGRSTVALLDTESMEVEIVDLYPEER
jgi:putative phosphoesterase